MANSCEQGAGYMGYLKGGVFLWYLSEFYLLKKQFDAWI
jgi:hypothetical protein